MSGPFLSPAWHRVGPLRPRLRPNLTVNRHRVQGQAWYVVHGAVTGKAHRFTPSVYAIVGAMDGRRTVDEIWRDAGERGGEDAPSQTEIVDLLAQLHAADLLSADASADATELFRRYAAQRRRERIGRFANPMSIRLPLVDPDRFLAATLPLVRPFLSWFGLLLWAAAIACAAALLAPRWGELTENLSDRILTPNGLAVLAVVFPLLKLLHELGHAYSVKAGGGEVHEMGVTLIALLPVPYVEGSASAAFRSKWRRAGVAAAGMLVESFVAALAGILWATVEPGLVRGVAFNVMLVAGVSTVLFNANPLLKLDGYYILSDLIEVPNLAGRATRFWGWMAERGLFGAEAERPDSTPFERLCFVVYGPLALAARLLVLAGISFFIASEWFVLGAAVAVLGVLMGVAVPVAKALWHVLTSPRLHRVRTRAVAVTLVGSLALASFVLFVPVPIRTTTEGVVWLGDDAMVRAGVNGVVTRVAARPGARVRTGDLLLEAEEPILATEAEVTRAQIEALRARLVAEEFSDRVKADLTRQEIRQKSEELRRAEQRLGELKVRAGIDGILEIPKAEHLEGRWVKRGDVLGYVTLDAATHVRAVVSQADVDLVRRPGTSALVLLPGDLWNPLAARLVREVPAASDKLPSRALATDGGGHVAAETRDPKGASQSLERWFQLDLELPPGAVSGRYGSRVFIRFDHGLEPLAEQWWRRGRQLFLARLAT